jgi:hypothetical protein
MKGEKAYDAGSIVPALAQNARAGHPLFVLCPRFQRLGHPSRRLKRVLSFCQTQVVPLRINFHCCARSQHYRGLDCSPHRRGAVLPMAREEVESGIDPNHHSSRNRFSCWPCLRCPSLHGLYARLSGFSDGRVAIGSDRGHRHWDRRFCVQHRQQGRGYNLRADQYPRPRLLGIRRLPFSPWVDRCEPYRRRTAIQTGRMRA